MKYAARRSRQNTWMKNLLGRYEEEHGKYLDRKRKREKRAKRKAQLST